MSLTSYRAAPSRANYPGTGEYRGFFGNIAERYSSVFLTRFGSDLLSHVLRRSTIGAAALNGRVRDGIGCFARAMTTKPRKKHVQVNLDLLTAEAWLPLDQIKPIEQLVPVN